MQVLDLLIIIFTIVAIYGIWRFAKSEENDYRELRNSTLDISADVEFIKKTTTNTKQLAESLVNRVDSVEAKVVEVFKQIDEAQEHMAKLRMQQMRLREKMLPKKIQVQIAPPQGAIPFELMTSEKPPELKRPKLIRKVKKQLKELSK